MGIRRFLRNLFSGARTTPNRHRGHDLADTVRDAIGPQGGGGDGGRMTGSRVYRHLEDNIADDDPRR